MKFLIGGVHMVVFMGLAIGEVERLEPEVMRRCLECTMGQRGFYLKLGNDSGFFPIILTPILYLLLQCTLYIGGRLPRRISLIRPICHAEVVEYVDHRVKSKFRSHIYCITKVY